MPQKRINYWEAENFRKLQFIRITPEENQHTIVIAGNNGEGKTSATDALCALVGGKRFFPARRPIHDGELHAHVKGEIGEGDDAIFIRRDWDRKTPDNNAEIKEKTQLRYKDGRKITTVTTFLDDLLGSTKHLTFDPVLFLAQKEKQRGILLSMLGIEDLLAKNKEKYDEVFDQRTDTNRAIKHKKGVINEILVPGEDIPTELLSAGTLSTKIAGATKTNAANENKRSEFNAAQSGLTRCNEDIARLKEQLKKEQENQERYALIIEELEDVVDGLKDIDTAPLIEQIQGIEARNEIITKANEQRAIRKRAEDEYQELKAESDDYTNQLETIKAEKTKILKEADFPVTGLSVDDSDVLYDGMPLNEECDSRQRIIAMDIALSRQPKDGLRFVRIRDASLLDEESIKEISKKAEEEDALLLLEIVGGCSDGITIRNGLIVKDLK